MRLLGIDYGTKRVGLAVSDEGGQIAFPRSVVNNTKDLVGDIKKICLEENISDIVIGESRNLDWTPNPLMKDIESFMEELKKEINTPLHLEPEFLTSHQAQKIQGKNEMLDASAAAIILQRFLDRKNNNPNPKIFGRTKK